MRMPSFKGSNLTVTNIIEIAEEIEESRISGHEVSIRDPNLRTEQFQATKRWNAILTKFYKEMPRKKNWRQLRSYNKSFTGKEAVDFLLVMLPKVVRDKTVNESNAVRFMSLLLAKNLVENVRDPKNKVFTNNASLYHFKDTLIVNEIEETAPLRRTSSYTSLKPTISSSCFNTASSNLNRRISSSHSNLAALIKASNMVKSSTSIQRAKSPTSFSKSTVSVKTLTPFNESDEHAYDAVYCSTRSPKSVGDEGDYLRSWREMLVNSVGIPSLADSLCEGVTGESVLWNTTQIGQKGVVRPMAATDDLANEIKKLFLKLMEWSADNQESPNTVFEDIFRRLGTISPIIPALETKKLVKILHHYYKDAYGADYDNQFIRNDSPMSMSFDNSKPSRLMRYIDDEAVASTSTAKSRFEENILISRFAPVAKQTTLAKEAREKLLSVLHVFMLGIKPRIRRQMNLICRFVRRINFNKNLRLHEGLSNVQYIEKRLWCCLVDTMSVTLKDGYMLVQLMVEEHSRIFAGSPGLIRRATQLQELRSSNTVGSPASKPVPYCHRMEPADYERQQEFKDRELLKLLDDISLNENLSQEERIKKLNSFQQTYPTLFAMRFPNGISQVTTGFSRKRAPTPTRRIVSRIRSLTRKDSTKKRP